MSPDGLFEPDGSDVFVSTDAAVGPWDSRLVHGAAVSALMVGQLTSADTNPARVTVEILAPVPVGRLTLSVHDLGGGARVQRHRAELASNGRLVATATSVAVRQTALELPEKATQHESPFDPHCAPNPLTLNRAAAETIGWESFDSLAVLLQFQRVEGDRRPHMWVGLAVPVVAGTPVRPVEIAAVAADYAQQAVNKQLPYDAWSFRNADLTMNLARTPVGSWIGARCEAVVAPAGAGFNAADLFDGHGRVGRSAATVVVEPRPDPNKD